MIKKTLCKIELDYYRQMGLFNGTCQSLTKSSKGLKYGKLVTGKIYVLKKNKTGISFNL